MKSNAGGVAVAWLWAMVLYRLSFYEYYAGFTRFNKNFITVAGTNNYIKISY